MKKAEFDYYQVTGKLFIEMSVIQEQIDNLQKEYMEKDIILFKLTGKYLRQFKARRGKK